VCDVTVVTSDPGWFGDRHAAEVEFRLESRIELHGESGLGLRTVRLTERPSKKRPFSIHGRAYPSVDGNSESS
jgi:hypothetical protein